MQHIMIKRQEKTICIIPARKNSKRIKNKNLLKIRGETLIDICIKLSIKSNLFEKIILSSDSNKILNIGKKYKILTIKRGEKISEDKSTTDSVVRDVVSKAKFKFQNIVILQVTSPLRKIETLRNFLKHCIKKKLSHCLSVSVINDNISEKNKYFKPLGKNLRRSQSRKPYIYENGLFYFVKKEHFLKRNKIYPKKNWNFFITDKYESIDINELNDYLVAKKFINK